MSLTKPWPHRLDDGTWGAAKYHPAVTGEELGLGDKIGIDVEGQSIDATITEVVSVSEESQPFDGTTLRLALYVLRLDQRAERWLARLGGDAEDLG